MIDVLHRRPRLLVLTLLLIAVAGLSALQVLPRAEDPELVGRFGTVITRFPGASAKHVEALVTDPLEDELREIEEISELASTSVTGVSSISIELGDQVANTDEVWSRVRDRLGDAAVGLPPGARAPEFEDIENQAYTLIVGLIWRSGAPPSDAVMGRLADDLADRLRGTPGTQSARRFGEAEEEIVVEIDPSRLASYGLTASDVARAIQRADAKVPAGTVHAAGTQLRLEVAGELDSIARIESLPVHEGRGGRFLRVADLGVVRKTAVDPPRAVAVLSGQPGVAVASRMQTGYRVDRWAERARAVVEEFRAEAPRGLSVDVLFDQSTYTEHRLIGLFGNFAAAAALVALVIWFTMGWRSAVLVGSALPLTSLMVFAGMRLLGVPIHQMSITGLIIALGLLIDNAIVMVDEVRHWIDEGHAIGESVLRAVRGLAVPLAGSTATTVLAFMPIVLMPGPAGEFVGSIAVSVILALLSSLFLALTVIPALSGWLLRPAREDRPGWSATGFRHGGLTALYERALNVVVRKPALSLGIALFLPALGYAGFGALEEQFFPATDRDQFQVEMKLPWQASIHETRRQALAVREAILEESQVADVHWFLGESAPRFYYNVMDGRADLPFYGQALVQLHDSTGAIELIGELQGRLDRAFPGIQLLARPIEQGPPVDAPVEIRVYGSSLPTLRDIGERLRSDLAALPAVTHTRATLEGGRPKLLLQLDEESARLAGLRNTDIAQRLLSSTDGVVGGSFIETTEELPVRVRLGGRDRADTDRLATVDLAGDGGWTPLSTLGELVLRPEEASIPHFDGRRCNTIQAYTVAGTLPNATVRMLRERLSADGFALPPSYSMEWGGEAEARDEAVGKLMAAAVVLLVLMGASLVLSFDSFRMAAIIGCVAVAAAGLSLLALRIFGYPFGFMAIVGTMGLVGVAVNDSIVVLASLRRDTGARSGDLTAVVNVLLRSTRHLLSTTLTTMAGFTPLILAGGSFWPPLAVSVAGGVAGATLLALTFVPTMFLLLQPRR